MIDQQYSLYAHLFCPRWKIVIFCVEELSISYLRFIPWGIAHVLSKLILLETDIRDKMHSILSFSLLQNHAQDNFSKPRVEVRLKTMKTLRVYEVSVMSRTMHSRIEYNKMLVISDWVTN